MAEDLDPDDYAVPHSPAWFARLERANARLSSFVAQTLEAAGRTDACAVCGEWPSLALRRLGGRGPGEPGTVMLCGDCRLLRRALFSEVYEPL